LTASQNSVLCEHSQLIIIIVAQAILRWKQVKYETILLSFCVHNGFLVKRPCRIQIKRPLLMHSNYLSREQYQCFDFLIVMRKRIIMLKYDNNASQSHINRNSTTCGIQIRNWPLIRKYSDDIGFDLVQE
jgi:hypothetical protein